MENEFLVSDYIVTLQSGDKIFLSEKFVAYLLLNDLAFVNFFYYGYNKNEFEEQRSCMIFLVCNDLFDWGCADAECVESEKDLESLCDCIDKYGKYGCDIWCCIKRNLKPQIPVQEIWKEKGFWPEVLNGLLENN